MSGVSRLAATSCSKGLIATTKQLHTPITPIVLRKANNIPMSTTTSSGAYFKEPTKVPLGIAGVGGTITAGLLLGAAISKNMASFLEENELFVPSDDDDDD